MHLGNTNPYSVACSSRPLLDLIGARWTLLMVGCLTEGKQRFSELSDRIGGITPKALTRTLRLLVQHGLVLRTVHPVVPPKVEYELSPLGQTLRVPIEGLLMWADDHIDECHAAQHLAE